MNNLHTIAIIQARMSASRLPGKVLRDIVGQPMLVRVYERTCRAKTVDKAIIATTTDETDDPIEKLCKQRGYPYYRGSNHDVLDRYYRAAKLYNADVVVRITADCPVIDPTIIDKTVSSFLGFNNTEPSMYDPDEIPFDFAANRLPPPWGRTYPIGLDIEVCTFKLLELAWKEAVLPHQREHVMPFFYEQPDRFRILHVTHDPDYGKIRWTVDTSEDLELIRLIYSNFSGRDDFTWLEILNFIRKNPNIAQINAEVKPKHYREIDSRLENKSSKITP